MPRKPPPVFKMPDDTNVPRQQGASSKEGWKIEHRGFDLVLVAPDGRVFIRADKRAKADLIVEFPGKGLPTMRYQLYDKSGAARNRRREQREERARLKARKARR